MYSKVIVRRSGKNFAEGITTSNLGKPDFEKALEQHSAYCDALTACGPELNPGCKNQDFIFCFQNIAAHKVLV